MKYGKLLIILGLVNVLILFSGFPTSWKKALIIITSFFIISVGWILKTIAQKRKERVQTQAAMFEQASREELNRIADEVVHTMSDHVEQEIDRI